MTCFFINNFIISDCCVQIIDCVAIFFVINFVYDQYFREFIPLKCIGKEVTNIWPTTYVTNLAILSVVRLDLYSKILRICRFIICLYFYFHYFILSISNISTKNGDPEQVFIAIDLQGRSKS